MHLETHLIDCPYCGESIELTLEPQDAEQVYFEDCHVCCQPIHISVMRNEFCDSYYLHCKSADD